MLSRREHSRFELTRKLHSYAENPVELEEVISDLERQGFFNEERFASVFARNKGAKFGVMRVKQELAQHKLQPELAQKVLADLKVTELERAREVWQRRFLNPPASLDEKLKQHRFLMQRGFGNETIQKLFRVTHDD